MRCPRCKKTQFGHDIYQSVPVDRCGGCGGVWLDAGELGAILKAQGNKPFDPKLVREVMRSASAGIPEAEKQSQEHCPKCNKAMSPLNFSYSSGVIVDTCSDHGLWFDKGELQRIEAFHQEWESKKDDIKLEYRARLQEEERATWDRYDQMRDANRRKMFFPFLIFCKLDWLQHQYEKGTRK
jgi:Zn-finger nucleic acid-binding protein